MSLIEMKKDDKYRVVTTNPIDADVYVKTDEMAYVKYFKRYEKAIEFAEIEGQKHTRQTHLTTLEFDMDATSPFTQKEAYKVTSGEHCWYVEEVNN